MTMWNNTVAAVFLPCSDCECQPVLFGVVAPESRSPIGIAARPIKWRAERMVAPKRNIAANLSHHCSIKNQTAYSFFGVSAVSSIAIGRDKWLLRAPYVDDYCAPVSDPIPVLFLSDVAALGRKRRFVCCASALHRLSPT